MEINHHLLTEEMARLMHQNNDEESLSVLKITATDQAK
jgi:hypothetical protein